MERVLDQKGRKSRAEPEYEIVQTMTGLRAVPRSRSVGRVRQPTLAMIERKQ